jgi:hypothetical protein
MLAKATPTAAPASRATCVPEPAESGKKQKKQKQQKLGGGGIALFFTLLVLVGLVAGAVVYGRPYLFPEEGDQLNPVALDTSALIEASAVAASRRVSGTTSFGVAVHPDRRIDIAAVLPPALEFCINASLAFAEFSESGDIDIAGTALLAISRGPYLLVHGLCCVQLVSRGLCSDQCSRPDIARHRRPCPAALVVRPG